MIREVFSSNLQSDMIYYGAQQNEQKEHVRRELDPHHVARGGSSEASNASNES